LLHSEFIDVVSQETLEDILSQNLLNIIDEMCLFSAVVLWGSKQLGATIAFNEHAKIEVFEKLRVKTKSLIRLLRFRTFNAKEFAALFNKIGMANVLTYKEKFQLLSSLSLNTCDHMPQGYSVDENPRMLFATPGYDASFSVASYKTSKVNGKSDPLSFNFEIDNQVYLLGLKLFSLNELNIGKEVKVQCVLKHQDKMMSTLTVHRSKNCKQDEYIKFKWPALLQANTKYVIYIYHMTLEERDAAELTYTSKTAKIASLVTSKTAKIASFVVSTDGVAGDVHSLLVAYPRLPSLD